MSGCITVSPNRRLTGPVPALYSSPALPLGVSSLSSHTRAQDKKLEKSVATDKSALSEAASRATSLAQDIQGYEKELMAKQVCPWLTRV